MIYLLGFERTLWLCCGDSGLTGLDDMDEGGLERIFEGVWMTVTRFLVGVVKAE